MWLSPSKGVIRQLRSCKDALHVNQQGFTFGHWQATGHLYRKFTCTQIWNLKGGVRGPRREGSPCTPLQIPDWMGPYRYQDGWKWFLPASRSSLNLPGPQEKTKNLGFRTRQNSEKLEKKIFALLTPFLGTPPGERWTR